MSAAPPAPSPNPTGDLVDELLKKTLKSLENGNFELNLSYFTEGNRTKIRIFLEQTSFAIIRDENNILTFKAEKIRDRESVSETIRSAILSLSVTASSDLTLDDTTQGAGSLAGPQRRIDEERGYKYLLSINGINPIKNGKIDSIYENSEGEKWIVILGSERKFITQEMREFLFKKIEEMLSNNPFKMKGVSWKIKAIWRRIIINMKIKKTEARRKIREGDDYLAAGEIDSVLINGEEINFIFFPANFPLTIVEKIAHEFAKSIAEKQDEASGETSEI